MSLVLLITFFTAPYSFVYISFYFLFCEVLLNSLLASLNLRESLREQTMSDGPHSFPPQSPRSNHSPGFALKHASPGKHASLTSPAAKARSTRSSLPAPANARLSPPPKRGKVARVKELVRARREGRRESETPLTVRVETSTLQMVSTGSVVSFCGVVRSVTKRLMRVGQSVMEMSPISRTGSKGESTKQEVAYAL